METTAFGREGETLARAYLEKKGMRFIERNFRRTHGEIDLIMKDGEFLVFVEVKTRRSLRWGLPIEAVTPLKQRRIRDCAALYYAERHISGCPARFDIVEILALPGKELKIRHLANAF